MKENKIANASKELCNFHATHKSLVKRGKKKEGNEGKIHNTFPFVKSANQLPIVRETSGGLEDVPFINGERCYFYQRLDSDGRGGNLPCPGFPGRGSGGASPRAAILPS